MLDKSGLKVRVRYVSIFFSVRYVSIFSSVRYVSVSDMFRYVSICFSVRYVSVGMVDGLIVLTGLICSGCW